MANNRPDPNSPPGTPRWVKIFVIGFIVLVGVFVILHLLGFGMGGHGMSIHSLFTEYRLSEL